MTKKSKVYPKYKTKPIQAGYKFVMGRPTTGNDLDGDAVCEVWRTAVHLRYRHRGGLDAAARVRVAVADGDSVRWVKAPPPTTEEVRSA
ncbi:MAG: hypothetical protein GWP91_14130 [Rhodobacterales bacterium]|nr:hypothetical protein [Rhodobacterales bacterium]